MTTHTPLAALIRPTTLDAIIGHSDLLGAHGLITTMVAEQQPRSLIFWGPPGVGKTTLARALGHAFQSQWVPLSAVNSGVKDIRDAVANAEAARALHQHTLVFIDEIHRFNKSQQDALLPHVESGLFTLIGATTENPGFAINNALMSRMQVIELKPLNDDELTAVFERAQHALGDLAQHWPMESITQLVQWADGDTRRMINAIEQVSIQARAESAREPNFAITLEWLSEQLGNPQTFFDNQGDYFYDQISALHKSVRGSSPDGALYWLCRMLDGGADPLYLARRIVRMASEDIGNADPRALQICLNAWDTQQRLGSPEGELALAQAVVYLAAAPKSNAVYMAFKACMKTVQQSGNHPVPNHLRNAPTQFAKGQGYGSDYRYAHDEPNGYAAGETYLPEGLVGHSWYSPVERGLEIQIKTKLDQLKVLDQTSSIKRS